MKRKTLHRFDLWEWDGDSLEDVINELNQLKTEHSETYEDLRLEGETDPYSDTFKLVLTGLKRKLK